MRQRWGWKQGWQSLLNQMTLGCWSCHSLERGMFLLWDHRWESWNCLHPRHLKNLLRYFPASGIVSPSFNRDCRLILRQFVSRFPHNSSTVAAYFVCFSKWWWSSSSCPCMTSRNMKRDIKMLSRLQRDKYLTWFFCLARWLEIILFS